MTLGLQAERVLVMGFERGVWCEGRAYYEE